MLSTLLDRVTRVMERDKPRLLHPADFLTQPILVWVPIAAIGFVWAQDYLGMATFCDPKEGDSVRTCDYVNSFCGGSMSNMTSIRDYNLNTEGVSVEQSRRFLMILLVQAVFLRAVFISWWGMSVGEDLLMHIKAWVGLCSDIAEGIEDWYGDIWPDTKEEKVQLQKANVKLYRVQLLVNDAQDHLKHWINKHASRFYYNFVAYSLFNLGCLVLFGWICGIMSISMFSPQFACEARGVVYNCVDRNAQIIELVVFFNFMFCFILAALEAWTLLSTIQEISPNDLFFCQRIPGMSLRSFTSSLNEGKSTGNQPFVSRLLSKYFPRHQYLGLALFSKYMYMNRFMIDRLSYLERFCHMTEQKDVMSLRDLYTTRANHVAKNQDVEEVHKKDD